MPGARPTHAAPILGRQVRKCPRCGRGSWVRRVSRGRARRRLRSGLGQACAGLGAGRFRAVCATKDWRPGMQLLEKVAGAARAEQAAGSPPDRDTRGRLQRLVDPLDVAGRMTRAVSPHRPTPDGAHLVYYLMLGGFVLAELVEPPVAALLAVGHLLVHSHNRYLEEVGEALAEAD